MLEVFSVTDARKKFLPLIDHIESEKSRIMITKHGRPVAVVINYEDYSRMIETLKLMEDSDLVRRIRQDSVGINQNKMIVLSDTVKENE